ncbi:MAG: Membrane-associated zinc metalloprotease [candidate division TA06 bacterium 32_111]|uniref:Zinc metalloprotease n=2 Tax=Bacteria candidate phyla TaxID=1783234 RepID=A0A101I2P3_UNCT6|nr:MAG: Membrane-associated zinc metalloprotease [candidate division TA06 bacterium 32_111]KUK87284.1 MAG: Membrane-associated zinc metalloprotease [candidate division TA06 bacterium 34_109]HAF07582.1 RIP metalloprotease RseP [candidate division WOR-3 bacterium]HCP16133.1 RIP metalloprotease RseP [candidate division WOR-3 bacterium]
MSFLIMVLTLGIMVIVHEFGHFIVAKIFKIGVLTFSVGLGKKLFGFKKNETDYVFSVLPFGGYVRLKGMEDFESKDRDDDDFMKKSPVKRILVIFSGPFFNFIFAFIIIFITISFYGVTNIENAPLYDISGPYKEYFQKDDLITEVNGNKVKSFNDIFLNIVPDRENIFKVLRGKEEVEVKFKIDKPDSLFITPKVPSVVGIVNKNSAAEKYGIFKGDRIVMIDTFNIVAWQDISEVMKNYFKEEMDFKVVRGNDTLLIKVKPEIVKDSLDGEFKEYGFLGIGFSYESKKVDLLKSLKLSYERVKFISISILKFLQQMFTGRMALKNLGGPLSIYTMTDQTLKIGFETFLSFLAFFSINLFIFNLIPFPPLDGSYILIYLFELVTKVKANKKFMQIYQYVGIFVLFTLIIIVTFNDILRIFKG